MIRCGRLSWASILGHLQAIVGWRLETQHLQEPGPPWQVTSGFTCRVLPVSRPVLKLLGPGFTEDKGSVIGWPGHISSVSVSPIAYWSRQTPDHFGSLESSGVYFKQQLTARAFLSSVPLDSNQFQKQFSNPA